MIFNFISVNNKQSRWENEGLNYYVKQFPKHISINFVNIKGQQHPKRSINEIKELESNSILAKINNNDHTISFDLKGESLCSKTFSRIIKSSLENHKKTNFIIGGSFGVSDQILNRSDKVISFSNMTFPHRLFKIILMEQIYRSFAIINNSPYHK